MWFISCTVQAIESNDYKHAWRIPSDVLYNPCLLLVQFSSAPADCYCLWKSSFFILVLKHELYNGLNHFDRVSFNTFYLNGFLK